MVAVCPCQGQDPLGNFTSWISLIRHTRPFIDRDTTTSSPLWITDERLNRVKRLYLLFAKPRDLLRVCDKRVLGGIIHVQEYCLRWSDVLAEYGPAKTLCNRLVRWSMKGIFAKFFKTVVSESADVETTMIAATHVKAYRTAAGASLGKTLAGSWTGRTRGGLNSKQHMLTDGLCRPIRMLLSAGNISSFA